jgi:TP901 family phage tail tape measure protein
MADIESNIRFGVDTSDAIASIKMLQSQISAFQRQMSSSSAANAESARKLRRGLLDDLNATGQWSASIKTIQSSSDSFTRALEKNKLSMGEYFSYAASQTKTFGGLFRSEFNTIEKVARERVKDLQTQYISLGRDANGALKSIAVRPLRLDMESLATQTAMNAQRQQVFNQLLKQGSTNLLNFGKNTQWAGRQLMVGFTIPLSIFGNMASKTFMELEQQAIRFKRVYGDLFTTPDEANEMLETLKELGKEFTKYGVAVEKTLGLAADAAAMGKTGTELLDQVTEANRLAVLGNVEQAQALETTISLTNAFGIATEQLASKIDFLNAVENQTVTSIEDLTIAVPKAGPVIQQLGGDVEDLAFFLTAMKEGGINASEGANALKSGLASIINPTAQASTMLKVFGINLQEINAANRGDVKGLVLDFAEALDRLDPSQRAQAIEQLFGKFQFARLSTLFQNVIQDGTQAQRVLELTNATTQELAQLSNKELKSVEESTTFRFRKAIEEFQLAIAPVGEQFLKLITPIIEFATGIIEKFNGLSDGAKSFITGLTVLFGAIGPIAIMTFGLLANGIANIIKGFTFIRELFMKTGKQSTVLGEQLDYMTTEQLNAAAVAASLEQVHSNLIQVFSTEAGAVKNLGDVYRQAFNEQQRFDTGRRIAQGAGLKLASGIVSVPGPKGAGDIVPAVLSPGEAVIPADAAKKYAPIIQGMIAGNLPGFSQGVMLGMPRSGKSTQRNREAAQQIYEMFKQSSYANVPPTEYGHQLSPTSGHSFPIFGLGGVYMGPNGQKVFVKPVMDEKAAVAEMRATEIARKAHGLKAPEQRIVVIRDPQDPTRQRRFLALESALDATFINNDPMAMFNEDQYFKQLVASLLRVDKDLSASNVFGDVVADVGPAGVFSRASGLRDYAENLPSMEEQAMINLLGIKGGAKRAFAESTLALMQNLTPQQYHQRMIGEIQRVLPLLEQTVTGFRLSNPQEAKAYQDMIARLRQGLAVDWSKFHAIHSAVKPSKPKQTGTAIPGYANGVVSVPGPKGAGDVMPAMLTPGEAVIPAEMAKRYAPIIEAMIAGNIPGFSRGKIGSQSKRFGQEGEFSAQASHFGMFTPSELADTLEELKDELGDFVVDVFVLGDKLEDGTREVSKITTQLADLDIEGKDFAAGGMTYAGTTTIEQKDRNQAYNAAGIRGAAFTLEEAAESGKLAAAALASGSRASQRYADQLQILVAEGKEAEILLSDSSSIQNRYNFMIENARKALEESLLSQGKVKSVEEARAMASERLADVQDQVAQLQAQGLDEEQLLQKLKQKLAVAMLKSGTGEFGVGPSGTGGGDLRDVLTGRGRSHLRRQFGPEEDPNSRKFAYGGRSTAVVASAFVSDMAEQGTDFAEAALQSFSSAFRAALKRALGINSPSAEYEAISQSVTAGVRLGTDDAMQAGEDLAEATAAGTRMGAAGASGAVRVGRRRVTTNPEAIASYQADQQMQTQTKQGPRRASRPSTDLGKEERERAQATAQATVATEEQTTSIKSSQARMDRLNSTIMQGTFALTSLAGVGVMAGGAIGEISQKIFEFSGLLFALMQVTQLLTQAKIVELAQSRISVAQQAMAFATYGTGIAASTGFAGSLVRAGIAVSAFLGPVGWVVLGLTALAGIIALIVGAQEEQKKKIEGLGNAAFLTSEKMKKASALLGFDAKTNSFGQNITEGTAAARNADEASKIETLRADEGFKTDFASEIQGIKDATKAEAETALSAVAMQMFSVGAPQDAVDAYVRAIAQEAERTDLNLEFANIDFAKQGKDKIIANAKSMAEDYQKAFKEGTSTIVTQDQTGGNRKVVTSMTDEAKSSMQAFSGTIAASFSALKDGFANGLVSAADFNEGLQGVMTSLSGLGEAELGLVLPDLYKKLGVEDLMKEIPLVQDQLLLLQADAAGIQIPETDKNALKNADKSAKAASVALRVRTKLKQQVEQHAVAQEKVNKKIEEEALINEQIASANVALADRVVQLENQQYAYDYLIQQGYTAAEAFDLAGDAGLAAGIKAATGAGVAASEWTDMKNLLDQVLKLEKTAPTGPGGGGDKSPLQQAIESLQDQRKEILESNAAFNKLRKAGFDTADAMKAAEDPILAAALATTKVGTKQWTDLINRIKETQRLLSKKEMQDLLRGGKVEIAEKRAQATVANALTTLGYTAEQIDNVLSDQEFTNTLADDLKDGSINAKEVLQRLAQLKQMARIDVDIAFATKEGAADEFQKRYDKVVGYLEAQKQVIEVDFQVQTADENAVIRDAENEIAGIQYKIDDLEAQLTGIEEQEGVINEEYDKRKKALDDVAKANDVIARQQKNQLTLADALSQGDIAAAAKAAQDMRAQSAQDSIANQGDLLELSKEQQLANLRSKDGRSRKQIEDEIKKLKNDIFVIEEERLEVARESIREAEYDKAVSLESINAQILRWDVLAAKVNEAKLRLTPDEMKAMEYQAGLIADLLDDWNNIEDKTAILKILKQTVDEELGTGDTSQDGKKETTTVDGKKETTTTTSSSSSSSDTTKGPGPQPPYSPGAGKTWKVVNNKWTAVDLPGPGPMPPYSPGAGKKWQLVGNKWTAVSAQGSSGSGSTQPTVSMPSLVPPMPPVSPGVGKKWELVNNQWKAVTIPKTGMQTINDAMNWLGDITGFKSNMNSLGIKMASGGMVKYMADGGLFSSLGTDVVPSMLTPGEFVVRRNAVNNFGVDRLKAINSGTYNGDSVYNYEVNINVQSNANADQIASSVIGKIKQIDSQRIKGNRF